MSDTFYCDREPYDRDAHDILFHNVLGLISGKQKNSLTEDQQIRLSSYNFTNAEMDLLEAYNKHYSSFLHCRLLLVRTEGKLKNHDDIVVKSEILHCKEILAYLERRQEMQSILNRFRKPNEVIHLTFASEYFEEKQKYTNSKNKQLKTAKIKNSIIATVIILAILVCIVYCCTN